MSPKLRGGTEKEDYEHLYQLRGSIHATICLMKYQEEFCKLPLLMANQKIFDVLDDG